MEISFPVALLVVGALLWSVAALSGVVRATILSLSILSVAAGIGLARFGIVEIDPSSPELRHLAELALVLTLFADGLIVERELLRRHWESGARALVIAMPITIGLLGLGAKALFPGLSWAEAFLLGSTLAPTDPVVSSVVVTAQDVPARIRHGLNLESGLNDGLAIPFILFFLILATPGGDAAEEGLKLLGEAVAGGAIGAALGYAAGTFHPRVPLGGLQGHHLGLFVFGIALAAFGLAELTIGNGLIAAFVAGMAMGLVEEETPEPFSVFSEYTSSIAEVVAFFAFGALIVATGYDGSIWALAALIPFAFLIARPAAVFVASIRSGLPLRYRAFIAWFGPKGIASMLFALIVLNSQAPDRTLVFDIASFVILASILIHGTTDTVATRWISGEAPAEEMEAEETGRPEPVT